jgi:hypothetical protein
MPFTRLHSSNLQAFVPSTRTTASATPPMWHNAAEKPKEESSVGFG